jgi:AcrR family transcriptional regulator
MSPRKRLPDDPSRIESETMPAFGDSGVVPPAYEATEPGWRARVVARSLAPAAEKAIHRGEKFISAASQLVLQSGGEDFTIQQVAAEAGCTLRSFYQHFPGKDDLLIALIEESQIVMARLLVLHAERFAAPLERLGSSLYWAFDERLHTARAYNAALMRFVQRVSLTSPGPVDAARRPVLMVFAGLIEEAVRDGALEDRDPERSAFALMAVHIRYTQAIYLGNDDSAVPPPVSELVRFCVQGLGAQVPVGWEERFLLSDEEAALVRRSSEKLASEAVRRSDRD